MQRIIIVFIAFILIAGIYLFTQPVKSPQSPVANTSANTSSSKPLQTALVTQETRERAQAHIEQLTVQTQDQVIDITQADNFVTGEQLLSLPNMAPEQAEIIELTAASYGSSIDNKAIRNTIPNSAQSSAPSNTESSLTGSSMAQSGSLMLTEQQLREGEIVITTGVSPILTLSDFQSNGSARAGTIDSKTIRVSLQPGQRLRLQELLSDPDLAAGTVFYIHAVSSGDQQGIWGILQKGLVDTFAKGIKLKESGRTLSADIPIQADETLENRRSSFLGNFLHNKVQDTYVYNYYQGLIGQDSNIIRPGQQLIIVSYTEAELISIFNYFTSLDAQQG